MSNLLNMACVTILPPVSSDLCDPKVKFGRIDKLLFTRYGDDLTADTLAAWTARMSNTAALPASGTLAPIRQLYVLGGMAEPDVQEKQISGGRKAYSAAKWKLALKADDTGEDNLNFLREMVGNAGTYAVWFESAQQMFGGLTGIKATLAVKGLVIPESDTDIRTISIEVSWEGGFPEVSESAIA